MMILDYGYLTKKVITMPEQRSYTIIGAGAVGMYYGSHLQEAGCEVHYLSRSGYEAMTKHGLAVETSEKKTLQNPVQVYQKPEDMPTCDVILIALKTTQNYSLASTLPSILKPESVLIPLQNGLGNEEFLATLAPHHMIVAATTTIGAKKIMPGYVYYSYEGHLQLAKYQIPINHSIQISDLIADFKKAKIETHLHEDYLLMRWKKQLWNICFNGLSVLHQLTCKTLILHHRAELDRIAEETISIASAYDKHINWAYFESMITNTNNVLGDHKSSMLQDYEKGNSLEVEYIYGNAIKAAHAKKISCPELEKLYFQLQKIQR